MTEIKNIFGTFLICLGVLALGLCAMLIWFNSMEDSDAERFASQKLADIQNAIEQRRENGSEEGDGNYSSPVFTSEEDLNDYKMEAVFIDGYSYIGYLAVPSVELELPVMEGWTEELIKLAPCRYYGALETHDLVIAGHNYKNGFRKLHSISKDDIVYFMDMNGNMHTYVVEEIEILEAEDVEPMVSNGWDLSLYTCTFNGKQRLTVRCRLSQS